MAPGQVLGAYLTSVIGSTTVIYQLYRGHISTNNVLISKQPQAETIPAKQRKKEFTHSSATLLQHGVAGTSCSVFMKYQEEKAVDHQKVNT